MKLDHNTRYAGFWRRLAAVGLDVLMVLPLVAALLYVISGSDLSEKALQRGLSELFSPALSVAIELAVLALVVFLWVRFRGTPGKLLLGCLIVDARSGQPLGVGRAILRYFGYLLSALPLMLGFIWIAFDKRKQGLHDKIAGSVVVLEDESAMSMDEIEQELR